MTDSADAAFAAVRAELSGAGFNLHGCLGIERYDAHVPEPWQSSSLAVSAQSALIVGAGGRALFAAFARSPEFARRHDPLDAYTQRVVAAAARPLDAVAVYAPELHGGVYADFVALGRAAGLGAPSRLGLLLHPVFGPWMSLRAVLLTSLRLRESPPQADFDPCRGCSAPCAASCPGHAVAESGFDIARCAATRRQRPPCRERCDARRACVVGPEHGYDSAAEAHHMRSLAGP